MKAHRCHGKSSLLSTGIFATTNTKAIRNKKYRDLDKTNYEKFITDLIGIRCLVLFKEDWKSFHNYILSQFENNVRCYVKDSIRDFDEDENHFYIAEKPKAHIRSGDAREIYDEVLPPDCVLDGKIYRSVHYILKYKGVYLEIQVRTLFEEGWGGGGSCHCLSPFSGRPAVEKIHGIAEQVIRPGGRNGQFLLLFERAAGDLQPAPGTGAGQRRRFRGDPLPMERPKPESTRPRYAGGLSEISA